MPQGQYEIPEQLIPQRVRSGASFGNTFVSLSDACSIRGSKPNLAISVTAKPADPQITYTIVAGDLPESADGYWSPDHYAAIGIGGKKNTSGAERTLHFQVTKNGVEVGIAGQQVVAIDSFFEMRAIFRSVPVEVGDVLGIKLWVDAASLTVGSQTLFTFPVQIATAGGMKQFINSSASLFAGLPDTTGASNVQIEFYAADPLMAQVLEAQVTLNGDLEMLVGEQYGLEVETGNGSNTDGILGSNAGTYDPAPDAVSVGLNMIAGWRQ